MKAIVLPVTDSGVPRIQIKPENTQDDAILNEIINRNGEGVQPDAGYTILSFEVNGDSFQSLTFGRNEEGVSGGGTWGSITGILSNQTDLQTALNGKVDENAAITGATKTKITYDSKGLVTVGSDASLAELTDDVTHRTVTDTQIATWNALIGVLCFSQFGMQLQIYLHWRVVLEQKAITIS